jgi:hypothetical protein
MDQNVSRVPPGEIRMEREDEGEKRRGDAVKSR